ncbi:DNA-binding PucR family transcriptional regulator [Herbihabitans rhizosphaerae]|uniref:DNA-binding PucR family transcriptional regulator n=1 Tax=Herbihabitans rhizosphaerae TaxID=1872711 RepID=A0A4Q7KIR2_9PSEU|nr:helix-turn-helix domain-containing protein [Herbihabitans rhizosphaerae]RZS32798.1 DNA-binding PucR family transcriptional regulator [Herbihabitans rhizosphaerae]
MISVRGVADRVGPTLLRVTLPVEGPSTVTDVVIAEAGRRTHVADGDLVLAVAAHTVDAAVELIRHCGSHGAAAVLLKPPLAGRSAVRTAARAAGVTIVEVHVAAAWAQLVWLLRTVLDAAADEHESLASTDGAPGFGDLFRLADAAAAVVDAPVTIEDANSRVLAYSARQDRTDPARVSTIMGRRVPDDVLARFRSRGVFRDLSRGRTTIFVPAQADGTLPRLIVPIRMGGELLGSMWAVVAGPVPDERAAAFADAAPVVALHLLRRRALLDAERRRSAELVRAILSGTGSVRLATAELDLEHEPHRVVAIDVDTEDALGAEGMRLALWERITAGIGRRPAVAELGDVLYAVVPDRSGAGGWPELRKALCADTDEGDGGALVAAGAPVELGELADSRAQADESLALLRAGLVPPPVATHEDVWAVLVLHRLAVAATGAGVTDLGPLPRLIAADKADGTRYVDTLYAWLRHPGDARAASSSLGIHPNTLRYRMARIGELAGVDLADPDVRLALLTQLAALRWR